MNTINAWQIGLRPQGGRPLLARRSECRLYARALSPLVVPCRILTFHAVDRHGHLVTTGSRADAGHVSRCAKNSIQKSYGRPISFLPIEPTPVADGLHLSRTVHYTLGQAAHHGWTGDPMLEASLVPDLLGYRVLAPEARELLARFVPSITDSDLMRHLEGLALAPGIELRHLAESAASAVGLVALQGRSGTVVQARITPVASSARRRASSPRD